MLKVMSFNIRYGTAEDGDHHWERRKSLVIARIQAFSPDLLGIQECRDDSQSAFLKENLPEYHFHGVQRAGGGDTALEMAPILFRKSSFQLIRSGCFWLSETPEVAGSKSWDSMFARTATWAELLHTPSGQALIFLNTHFDLNPGAIAGSARLLRHWSEKNAKDYPLVITGDFNADKNSEAWRHLTVQGILRDAYRMATPDPAGEGTFHGFGQHGEPAPIDWILVSRHFNVASANVDDTRQDNLFPSDHYPLTAILDWSAP